MSDSEFERHADRVLATLEQAIEASGASVDVETLAGGILQIEFDDGATMIINRHLPAREIWVAAKAGGFHFRMEAAAWRDTRSGEELFTALSRLLSAQCGRDIVLRGAAQPGL